MVAVLAEFRRKAEETRELHASSPGTGVGPGAGEGNCRRFVLIHTSHSDLSGSALPRSASAACGAHSGAPVTPPSAVSGITRTMAAHSMRASSRQVSTAELTSRGPLELPWGTAGYRSPARTGLQSAAASCIYCGLQSAAARARQLTPTGPLMSRDSNGPHIAASQTAHSRPPAQCMRHSHRCARHGLLRRDRHRCGRRRTLLGEEIIRVIDSDDSDEEISKAKNASR